MMRLQSIDKTGRSRRELAIYEENDSAVSIHITYRNADSNRVFKSVRRAGQSSLRQDLYLESSLKPSQFKSIKIETNKFETNVHVFKNNQGEEVYFRKNEVLIGFTKRSVVSVAKLISAYGLLLIWFDPRGNFGLFKTTAIQLDELLQRFEEDKNVLYAEPNTLLGADLVESSDLESDGVTLPSSLPWNHNLLNRERGGSEEDGRGVVIAIVDTPIHFDHPGFQEALYLKSRELHFGDSNPEAHAHGTSVASIMIDGSRINGRFSLGICPAAKLLPISIDTGALSSYAKRASAINYLAQSYMNRAAFTNAAGRLPIPRLVVNCSWQVRGNQDLTAMSLAFANLTASGAICVCSAGNDASNKSHYPSDYDKCVSVAGLTNTLAKSKNSNYGDKVKFAMPGGDGTPWGQEDILAAQGSSVFDYVSGTSFAAPHASGMLSVLWSKNQNLTGNEIVELARKQFNLPVESTNPAFVGQLGAGLICFK